MKYQRMPIEIESPESLGYQRIECNLAESSTRDIQFKEIDIQLQELTIAYGDHWGKPELRDLLAGTYPNINSGDILMTVGAAAALFIIHTSLLEKGDHLIVVSPNYATNLETPRAIGCSISKIPLLFEENFRVDLQRIKTAIRPNTKIISITTPHNPTGTVIERETIQALCRLAEERNIFLLADETYRDLSFREPAPLIASMSKKAISVSSLSKAYGIPGIRMGWLISQDPGLLQLFLAAKEQMYICNSVIDEEIAFQYMLKRGNYFPAIQSAVQSNFTLLREWFTQHPYLEWVEPSGGVVCFPRFKSQVSIAIEKFYSILLEKYKTYLGPGHWFELDKRSFRLGFGWEKAAAFEEGLKRIDLAIQECLL